MYCNWLSTKTSSQEASVIFCPMLDVAVSSGFIYWGFQINFADSSNVGVGGHHIGFQAVDFSANPKVINFGGYDELAGLPGGAAATGPALDLPEVTAGAAEVNSIFNWQPGVDYKFRVYKRADQTGVPAGKVAWRGEMTDYSTGIVYQIRDTFQTSGDRISGATMWTEYGTAERPPMKSGWSQPRLDGRLIALVQASYGAAPPNCNIFVDGAKGFVQEAEVARFTPDLTPLQHGGLPLVVNDGGVSPVATDGAAASTANLGVLSASSGSLFLVAASMGAATATPDQAGWQGIADNGLSDDASVHLQVWKGPSTLNGGPVSVTFDRSTQFAVAVVRAGNQLGGTSIDDDDAGTGNMATSSAATWVALAISTLTATPHALFSICAVRLSGGSSAIGVPAGFTPLVDTLSDWITLGIAWRYGDTTADTLLNQAKPAGTYSACQARFNLNATQPGPPVHPQVRSAFGLALVSAVPPVWNGGSAVNGYEVRTFPETKLSKATRLPMVITGLVPGRAHTLEVVAANSLGSPVESTRKATVVLPGSEL